MSVNKDWYFACPKLKATLLVKTCLQFRRDATERNRSSLEERFKTSRDASCFGCRIPESLKTSMIIRPTEVHQQSLELMQKYEKPCLRR